MALKFTLERKQKFKHLGTAWGYFFYIPQELAAKRVCVWMYAQTPEEKVPKVPKGQNAKCSHQSCIQHKPMITLLQPTGTWYPARGLQLGRANRGRFLAFKVTFTSWIISMLCPKDALLSDYIAFPASFSNLAHRGSPLFPYQLTKWQ